MTEEITNASPLWTIGMSPSGLKVKRPLSAMLSDSDFSIDEGVQMCFYMMQSMVQLRNISLKREYGKTTLARHEW